MADDDTIVSVEAIADTTAATTAAVASDATDVIDTNADADADVNADAAPSPKTPHRDVTYDFAYIQYINRSLLTSTRSHVSTDRKRNQNGRCY